MGVYHALPQLSDAEAPNGPFTQKQIPGSERVLGNAARENTFVTNGNCGELVRFLQITACP